MLDVALLGTGGMMPIPGRFLSSMILRLNGKLMLIDCGEGTQVSLKMLGFGFKAISTILFTHFHADHISGLPGMLLTIGNSGRTTPLTLVGPKGLEDIVSGLRKIAPELPYEINFIEIEGKYINIDIDEFNIEANFADHIINCYSYRINVKRKGKFNARKAFELNIPKKYWSVLQKGEDVVIDEKVYCSKDVIGDERKGISVSYCTDSRPVTNMPEFINGSDLFVCEGMYGENEKLQKAIDNKHMLFSEAADLAKRGNVKKLWLTHYSPSIKDPNEFFENALNVFENTELGYDRIFTTIFFED